MPSGALKATSRSTGPRLPPGSCVSTSCAPMPCTTAVTGPSSRAASTPTIRRTPAGWLVGCDGGDGDADLLEAQRPGALGDGTRQLEPRTPDEVDALARRHAQ